MKTLSLLFEEGQNIHGIEFGKTNRFDLIISKNPGGGTVKERWSVELEQLLVILSAFDNDGEVVRDAIDYHFYKYSGTYDFEFREKKIRLDFHKLLGHSLGTGIKESMEEAA